MPVGIDPGLQNYDEHKDFIQKVFLAKKNYSAGFCMQKIQDKKATKKYFDAIERKSESNTLAMNSEAATNVLLKEASRPF